MLCGVRALRYSNQLKEQNRKISSLLSAKWKETAQAVERLSEEYQKTRFRLVGMEYEKIARMAEEKRDQGDQLFFEHQMSAAVSYTHLGRGYGNYYR